MQRDFVQLSQTLQVSVTAHARKSSVFFTDATKSNSGGEEMMMMMMMMKVCTLVII